MIGALEKPKTKGGCMFPYKKSVIINGVEYSDNDKTNKLQSIKFEDQRSRELDFSCLKMVGGKFKRSEIQRANFNNSNLYGADFQQANLREATFENTILFSATFKNCNLRNANLMNSFLGSANFDGSDLFRANLINVDLENACLKNANLYGAFLSESKLRGVDFSNANLKGAYLHNTGCLCLYYKKSIVITPEEIFVGYERKTHDEWLPLLKQHPILRNVRYEIMGMIQECSKMGWKR